MGYEGVHQAVLGLDIEVVFDHDGIPWNCFMKG
jgi:hypothetical protein